MISEVENSFFNLYPLLPRIIKAKDSFQNSLGDETTLYVFATIYSDKINLHRHYGSVKIQEEISLVGIKGLLISEGSTEQDFSFKLAINGVIQNDVVFTFPAGSSSHKENIYPIFLDPDDVLTLYCTEKHTPPGVYVELNYCFQVSEFQQTLLKKIIACIDLEANINNEFLQTLLMFVDIDDCPEIYLPYLAGFLAFSLVNDWDLEKKRQFLKSLAYMYHHSGQKITFEAILNIFEYSTTVIELYKRDIYETIHYFSTMTPAYTTKRYGLMYPGALVEDSTLLGFTLPKGSSISGIEVSMFNRDLGSGLITVYLTLNGEIDFTRKAIVPIGSNKSYSVFPDVSIIPTDVIGFHLTIDSPGGVGDGWIQVYLDVTHSASGYHAARVQIEDTLSNKVLAALESFRPIHVLIRQNFEPIELFDEIERRTYFSDSEGVDDLITLSTQTKFEESLVIPSEDFSILAFPYVEDVRVYYYDNAQPGTPWVCEFAVADINYWTIGETARFSKGVWMAFWEGPVVAKSVKVHAGTDYQVIEVDLVANPAAMNCIVLDGWAAAQQGELRHV